MATGRVSQGRTSVVRASGGVPLTTITSSVVAPSTSHAAPSGKLHEYDLDNISEIETTLLTLRKPTDLKKVIDSIPKPIRAVPKNGLPIWYKLGLESKLPVPKLPAGKIVFSRGKMGEDVRRIGLGPGYPSPTFDLTDPYCYNVSYDYVAFHDPHLAFYFQQKEARNRMKNTGFATKDGRAICSLKEFNTYRKYLYNIFMDRVHMEMVKLDERAKDDLTLKKVETDVARRALAFVRSERAREQLKKHAQLFADETAEKKRRAKEQEKKINDRMIYLAEFNEKNRKDRVARALEKETRIRQRVQAAAEMELRRKITMIRQWRNNERKRVARLKAERDAKIKRMEDEADRKWQKRVQSQNQKIQEEHLLLKLYCEDMRAASARRERKAEIYAYNTDLELQRIRIANMKLIHGAATKHAQLVRKMGQEFEKSKRGAKGMSPELALEMAQEAMANANSTAGDALMTLGQARAKMDLETVLPVAPIRILDQMLETAVVEFARRRVHLLMRDVERVVRQRALNVFFKTRQPSVGGRRRSKAPRLSMQLTSALTQEFAQVRGTSILFGSVAHIAPDFEVDYDLKSAKDRPPTPVPSLTKLAEVTFADRVEDLPDPVTMASCLPERKKLLEMINIAAKLLSKSVSFHVQKGMDLVIGKVTMPHLRFNMEWGEVVEGLSDAVVNNRVNADCADLKRTSAFLSFRVLKSIKQEMIKDKQQRKSLAASGSIEPDVDQQTDFYTPGQGNVDPNAPEENKTGQEPNPVKEKRSSDGSLLLMNPVASGDNVTTGLNSTHKLKEETPSLVPCCEGRELQISEELVRTGLSAISVKHDTSVIHCVSMSKACEKMMVPPGLVKHRNSFRSLHRPDLKRVPYLRRMSPDELETLFLGYADFPARPKSESREDGRMSLPPVESKPSREATKETIGPDDGNGVNPLHPIAETRSGAEDIPAGMRLHGARARLYTSVLAGAKAGDQLDGNTPSEEYDHHVPDDPLPEEEVQLNEELQIILPPRCDDVIAESSTTTATTEDSTS